MQKNYSAGQKSLLISIPKHRNASQQLAIYCGDYSNLFVVQMPKSKRGFGTVILHALQNMVSFLLHNTGDPTATSSRKKKAESLNLD